MISFTLFALVLVLLGYAYYKYTNRLPAGVRPLPGPKGLPYIGRVHDVPADATWMKFYEWSQKYGPIYQMKIFGSVHVWISSEEIAHDLLSKRGAIYSDRPTIPNLSDNRTSGDYLALLGRTDTWKRQRKYAHQIVSKSTAEDMFSYPTLECKRLLYRMSKEPAKYVRHIEEYTSRTISRLSWGSPDHADELRVGTFGLLVTISPSGAVPNIVAPLSYLPTWLSPWKKRENARHDREEAFFHRSMNRVKAAVAKGIAKPSYMKMFVEEKAGIEKGGISEKEGSYVVGMMAIAGALTIGSPLQSYILAMCHFPWWQARVREEIDQVCGGRCPEWSDREHLPTLRAVMKETLRWRPPVPTGIPHCLEQDDVYNGYFIPKGATIHALEWGITRDANVYPDPDNFLPDRWLSPQFPTYREPLTKYPSIHNMSQFGFGRRTCQGVDIVEQELFLVMGGLAWGFNITSKKDKFGRELQVPKDKYTSLLIAKPVEFDFELRAVSVEREAEVEKMWRSVNGGKVEDLVVEAEMVDEKVEVSKMAEGAMKLTAVDEKAVVIEVVEVEAVD